MVCLPVESLVRNTDTSGVVVGWGKTSNNQSLDTLTKEYRVVQQALKVNMIFILTMTQSLNPNTSRFRF